MTKTADTSFEIALPGMQERLGLAVVGYPESDAAVRARSKYQALRQALQAAGGAAEALTVRLVSNSAPECSGPWMLSLAHSGAQLVALAAPERVAQRPVRLGVDTEQTIARDHARLAEFLGWTSVSRDLAHFYRRWTLAEALFKADGGERARRVFNALDCALETGKSDTKLRIASLNGDTYYVMWPRSASGQISCGLLCLGGE